MRIARNHNEWHLDFANALSQRTVIRFAGFPLDAGPRYRNNYWAIDRQEIMNLLDRYRRMVIRIWKRYI